MALPTDDETRKTIRIWQGCFKYFPDALAAVAQLSKLANEQHNPGQPMHWAKEKSTEELDSMFNHLADIASQGDDSRDVEGALHAVKVAWRALANVQRLADQGVNVFAEPVPVPEHRAKTERPCRNCGNRYWSEVELVACPNCVTDYVLGLQDRINNT